MRESNNAKPGPSEAGGSPARQKLLSLLLSREREKHNSGRSGIHGVSRTGPIPLSYAQERLWFLEQLEVAGTTYNAPLTLRLRGELREEALEHSLKELVRRHEILRTRFGAQEGTPHQVVDPPGELHLTRIDLTHLKDEIAREQAMLHRIRHEQLCKFDLSRGPLFRVVLIQLAADDHALLLAMHHIISDGWSKGILLQELGSLYRARLHGLPHPLPGPPGQYADYAIWQREPPQAEKLQHQMAYWKRQLSGAPALLELPADHPRPPVETFKGAEVRFTVPMAVAEALRNLARAEGATLFMTITALYQLLLSRWSGQRDIVIGSPIAGRATRELEGIVGCFVNMLVLRTDVAAELTFRRLLGRVKEMTFEAYAHQDVPFEALVKELRPERSLSAQPVFQAALALHNYGEKLPFLDGLSWTEIETQSGTTHFDLTLHVIERSDGLSGSIEYAADLFEPRTIERMASHFQVLLQAIVRNPDCPVWKLPLLSSAEELALTQSWNATTVAYPSERCVHELFSDHARRAPESVALVSDGGILRYGELEERSNTFARSLVEAGVRPDAIVGVHLERSIEMIVALLGILKAGGAYLPLSLESPVQRLRMMVEDADAQVLIARPSAGDWLREQAGIEVIRLDDSAAEHAGEMAVFRRLSPGGPTVQASSANARAKPENLSYVIYTSGSTGRPKGVLLHHRGLTNLACWYSRKFDVKPGECISQVASMMFDAMTFEIWPALSCGAKLAICPDSTRLSAEALHDWLTRHSVNIAFLPTPVAEQMISSTLGVPASVRYLHAGGDVLHNVPPGPTGYILTNNYGPTEITVAATSTQVNPHTALPIPIGGPVDNTEVHVLDGWMQRVPIGVRGELYISGAGVARGYLGLPGMTAERFVANPFGPAGTRLYRSGDIVRWRPDGTLEFVGRNDGQIKIRGYRIELSEIEAALLRQPGVKQALVQVRETASGQKSLVAYVIPVPSELNPCSVEELQAQLRTSLPDYMVPSSWTLLDQFPLTSNGKVDTKALPAPDMAPDSTREYEPPRGEAERALAGIWQELLSLTRVGRTDNFFQLGGHSLLIMQMLERLRRLGLSTDARRVFESQTLADLAAALSGAREEGLVVPPNTIPEDCSVLTPQMLPLVDLEEHHIGRIAQSVPGGVPNIKDIYPLAPLQEGILFHYLMSKSSGDVYARPMLLEVSSLIPVEEFARALQTVIDRHDILRTAILWEGVPRPVQVVCRRATLSVESINAHCSSGALEALQDVMRNGDVRLNLSEPPLMQVKHACDRDSDVWYALLHTHHLVFDNTSLPIVLSELSACLQGRAHSLTPPVPYRDYVARALARANSQEAEAYFRSRLADIDEPTAPFGCIDVHGGSLQLEEDSEVLDPGLTHRILSHSRQLRLSTAAFFHAAWALALSFITDRDDVVFGTVLLGRLQAASASRDTVGMLVNSLPMRIGLKGITARELLERAQRELAELLHHEQFSLADAQRCSGINGGMPLFTTLLNYLRGAAGDESQPGGSRDLRVLSSEGGTNYPITVSVTDRMGSFELQVKADQRIGAQRISTYMAAALSSLMDGLERTPTEPVLAAMELPATERHQVIEAFNTTRRQYSEHKLVHELFEDQVQRTPAAIALVYEGQTVTYADLNGRANRLARFLRDKDVGPETCVGICLERSIELVVGLLGILKAGAAYVPLDPSYPEQRQQYLLRNAAPRVVLTQERLKKGRFAAAATVITLDGDWNEIAQWDAANLDARAVNVLPRNLAYVIYTSGSTGEPKGAMNEHRGVVNRLLWMQDRYELTSSDRVLQKTPFSFDVSVWEFFWTLMCGARLVIARPGGHQDPVYLQGLIEREGVTTLHFVPSMLQVFLEQVRPERCASLRHIVCSGEELSPVLNDRCLACLPQARLSNLYGPTEAAVDVTAWECTVTPEGGRVPLGQPISNVQMYVLNRQRQPLPAGVAGEIYIGGVGVGRGYLNRPDLTAERFVPDPFSADPGARMYKTGDLGRWRAQGVLEYLGRNDHQVKIRGLRIELGEIETRLLQHGQVKETVVVARTDETGEKTLVAYVVPKEPRSPSWESIGEALTSYLKGILPEYMVPGATVVLERLPLSPNGKLDRRALPAPQVALARRYEAPEGATEIMLAEIWQRLLRVSQIGRRDNFFELGGHSLHGVRVISKVAEKYGVELPAVALFRYPTLEALARYVEKLRAECTEAEESGP